MPTNERIKSHAKKKGVAIWELADCYGVHENTMLRRLRHELTAAETKQAIAYIDEIAAARKVKA